MLTNHWVVFCTVHFFKPKSLKSLLKRNKCRGGMTMTHLRTIGTRFFGFPFQGSNQNNVKNINDIVKEGYLIKEKDLKSWYYVLRKKMNENQPARLECYENRNRCYEGYQPKKKYILKDCFNFSGKTTDQNKFAITLYMNKGSVCLMVDTETEQEDWLSLLHHHKYFGTGCVEPARKQYSHVWRVMVRKRGLAKKPELRLLGQNWLCLSSRYLSLVRFDDWTSEKKFHLSTVKACGVLSELNQFSQYKPVFFLQLGRFSEIGGGPLVIQTDCSSTTQAIREAVVKAMSNCFPTVTDSMRKRSTSDPSPEVSLNRGHSQCNNEQNNTRSHSLSHAYNLTIGKKLYRTLECHCLNENENLMTRIDRCSAGGEDSRYLPMEGRASPEWKRCSCSTHDQYIDMHHEDGNYSSSTEEASFSSVYTSSGAAGPHSRLSSPVGIPQHRVTSPLLNSPMSCCSSGVIWSSHSSAGSFSRSSSLLEDEYVPMGSASVSATLSGSHGSPVSLSDPFQSHGTSHYLDMHGAKGL